MPKRKQRTYEKEIGSRYIVDKLIGEGGFCVVFKATDKVTKEKVAIKRMEKSKPLYAKFQNPASMEKLNRLMYREAECMRCLKHENIINLLDFIDDGKNIYLIIEFAEGGELFALLARLGKLKENFVVHIMRQLVSALYFIHKNSYVHRDIKAENVLFKDKNATVVLLTDFGLTKRNEGMLHTNCGTLMYSAPELLRNKQKKQGYDKAIDNWALGVLCYYLLCGYLPFDDIHQREFRIVSKIMIGKVHFDYLKWNHITDNAKEFILDLLKVDPTERISMEDAQNHRFLLHIGAVKVRQTSKHVTTYAAVESTNVNYEIFPMMELSLHQTLAETRWKVLIYFSITLFVIQNCLKKRKSTKGQHILK